MPGVGWVEVIPIAARLLQLADSCAAILDLGVGRGLYGAVARQFRDEWEPGKATYLVGVEAWEAYKNPLWDLYDEIHVKTIQSFLWEDERRYQMILFLETLEHLPKQEGEAILEQLPRRLAPRGQLVVSVPTFWWSQGALGGNPYEEHRSFWTPGDLVACGLEIIYHCERFQVATLRR